MHNTKRVFALARTPVVFLGENPPTGEAYGPHTAAVPASRGPGKGGTAFQTDENDGPVEPYTTAPVAPPANGIPAAS